MQTVILVIVIALAAAVVLCVLITVVAGRRQRQLREAAHAEVITLLGDPRRVDKQVNCFGLESRGVTQVRGTGCLAVSETELVFILWYPRRTLRLSRDSILAVDTPTTHLGKTRGRPLLRIRYATESGGDDAVAWWVRDLPGWLDELGSAPPT